LKPARERTCTNCIHWNPDAQEPDNSGECRAFPPEIIYDPDEGAFSIWRITAPDDWCGLHRIRAQ
jgi:hypothetical protein